eukprot:9484034-Pyramimonas_sp.AAC.1
MVIGSEKARTHETISWFRWLRVLVSSGPPGEAPWPPGAALGALLEHLGSHLEAEWVILSNSGGQLGLSEAFWNCLGPSRTLQSLADSPRPSSGGE